MKVYISADIEGTAGIAHWDEAEKCKPGYDAFAELMTLEVAAACEGALAAGASEIVVKDAHWTGRNIDIQKLPEQVRLIRGWSGHPWAMIQDLDVSFDALIMTGYHSGAATGGHPLAHTMTGIAARVMLNGEKAPEYLLSRHAAASVGVPSVFISGDQALCAYVPAHDPHIHTVSTNIGIGGSANAMHPATARREIAAGVSAALGDSAALAVPELPESFEFEIWFTKHEDAYKASFFPGVRLIDPHGVRFESDDIFEVMRMQHFVLP